ncbi:hypothetical protein PR048_012983 [Dryococelus australis]|uniref:Uncharacterized protein n=1 Tax=Dryococelus australis TaxID=614101 RepID=A0ABQ9HQX4_9NEOP|nr:hypothetical protein PR048_012983 [Dryococelus australis]
MIYTHCWDIISKTNLHLWLLVKYRQEADQVLQKSDTILIKHSTCAIKFIFPIKPLGWVGIAHNTLRCKSLTCINFGHVRKNQSI